MMHHPTGRETVRLGLRLAALALVAIGIPGRPAFADPVTAAAQDAPPAQKVLGFGGFFFRAKDPKALAKWYAANLGVDLVPTDYGQHGWQQTAGSTAFLPVSEKTAYFTPGKPFMLNFRVAHLDAMVAQLRAAHIEVAVDPTAYPNGRFAHLADPEGNPLELWEVKDTAAAK